MLREEFKHDQTRNPVAKAKHNLQVDSLKEKAETNMKVMKGGLEELSKKIVALEDQLNAAIDEN